MHVERRKGTQLKGQTLLSSGSTSHSFNVRAVKNLNDIFKKMSIYL